MTAESWRQAARSRIPTVRSAKHTTPKLAHGQRPEPCRKRRTSHTLTLLPDGRVLAVGGVGPLGDDDYVVHSTTEIFDPVTNTWSSGPELSQPMADHSATLMPDSSVLLVGGISERNGDKYVSISTEFITP